MILNPVRISVVYYNNAAAISIKITEIKLPYSRGFVVCKRVRVCMCSTKGEACLFE